MVSSSPLNELDLVATSVADEAGFVALHDVAALLGSRLFHGAVVIGGHMVSLHARREGKDAVDVWRCLEISLAAAVRPEDLASDDGARALAILERAFGSDKSEGITALTQAQRLNPTETTARATRIRALAARLRT